MKMRTFFTSDSHFGHDNIIRHCKRPCREHPFQDGAQMDRALIDAWNSVVSPRDVVYHLGDFSLRPAETVNGLLKKLHGIKHLIVGNHDRVDEVSGCRLQGWASMREMAKISVDGQSVFLCHYPMREWPGMWQGTVHLYGHVHGNLQPLPGSMEVGADVWGGKPVQMMDILNAVMPFDAESEKQQRKSLRLRDWD
jgi:calcineurin-like phosphoesterase family protein